MDQVQKVYTTVGERIALARRQRGLTQEALANEIDLTRASVTNIELGRQKLQLHTLLEIARVLEVEPVCLLPCSPSLSVHSNAVVQGLPDDLGPEARASLLRLVADLLPGDCH